MRQVIASLFALLSAVALLLLGNGLLGTLVGIRLAMGGHGDLLGGVVMALYFVGFALGAVKGRVFIESVGHIRSFSAFASIFAAVALGYGFFENPVFWAGLRLVSGFCMAGLFLCTESWLNARASNKTRGAILSVYMVTLYASQAAGQYLLHLYDPMDFALFAVSAVLMSLALVPVALTRVPAPPLPPASMFNFLQLYRISPLGIMAAFGSGLALGAFFALGPILTQRVGFDIAQTAYFMSAAIIGGVLLQWPVGRLSDFFDRRHVILALALVLGASSLGVAATLGPGGLVMFLLIGLFGAAGFILYPLGVAHANDYIEAEDLVPAAGGMLLAYSVGATVGPVGAALVMEGLGPAGLFLFTTLVGAALGAFALWRMRIRPPVPWEEQTPFHITPRTTAAAEELAPWAGPIDDDLHLVDDVKPFDENGSEMRVEEDGSDARGPNEVREDGREETGAVNVRS